ncbi:MAG: acetolactate synthase small subunit [Chitinophagales bacterium]
MNNYYTLNIYIENIVGLLSRITAVFTRRHINIESLTVSETEQKGISRFTIVIKVTKDMVVKVTKQINKIIEVIHTEYHEEADLISSQLALFKVDLSNMQRLATLEALAMQNNARILAKSGNHIVLEKTGNRAILEAFLQSLKAFGNTEYVRSGRIAITMSGIRLSEILPQLPDINNYPNYSMSHHNDR